MSDAKMHHRPLMAGIEIRSKIPGSDQINRGTLTGLATQNSDGERVLVSNLHVMTDDKFVPSANAEIYQFDTNGPAQRVGRILRWVPMEIAGPGEELPITVADLAIAKLDDNIDPRSAASFALHNASHNLNVILPGTRTPTNGMDLTIVGAESGSSVVRVLKTGQEVTYERNGRDVGKYTELVKLDLSGTQITHGDSGAPCLVEEGPGQFRMACVLFLQGSDINDRTGHAFLASKAEEALGITFGLVTYAAPEKFRVSATTTVGELNLAWTNPNWYDNSNDSHEFQYREQGSTAGWSLSAPIRGTITSTTFMVPQHGAYEVRLRTVYNDANSNFEGKSDWVTATGTPLPPSNDATLSALSIAPTPDSFSPSFAAATTDYTATVGNAVASVQVTPTVNQADATVTVNGVTIASGQASHAITLPVGVRTITVVVTAQDGTTRKTYTVRLTRAAATQATTHTINVGAPSYIDSTTNPQLLQ